MAFGEVLDLAGADQRMIAAAALADVVEQPGDPQDLHLRRLVNQGRRHREFLLRLGLAEAVQALQQAQGVGVHGVDMEQIVLHQADRLAEGRQILAQHPVAIHPAQLAGDIATGAQQRHEQRLVTRVVAVAVVHQVAMVADQADGVGAYAFDLGVLGHQVEQLEQRRRLVAEQGPRAHLDVAAGDLETLVQRGHADRGIGPQDLFVEVLQQHVVEPGQGGDMAVVALHELFHRQALGTVAVAEQLGDGVLVVEQQPILGAPGEHVQGVADLPQEGLPLAQDAVLGIVHEALGDHVLVGLGIEVALGHPADHLDIAKPPGGALDVRLEVILGVVEAVVAGDLLLPLGLEEAVCRPHALAGQALAHGLAQGLAAGQGA